MGHDATLEHGVKEGSNNPPEESGGTMRGPSLVASIFLVLGLLECGAWLFLVQRFNRIFEELNVTLPMVTRVFVNHVAPLVFLGLLLTAGAMTFLQRREEETGVGEIVVIILVGVTLGAVVVAFFLPFARALGGHPR